VSLLNYFGYPENIDPQTLQEVMDIDLTLTWLEMAHINLGIKSDLVKNLQTHKKKLFNKKNEATYDTTK
jgi:hypothetical protein